MKKIRLLVLCLPLILLGMKEISFQINSYRLQPEFKKRADFLIACINQYKAETGIYPNENKQQELDCVPNAIVQSNEMFNSEKIVGKGAFILTKSANDGEILVIGNWYPPNLIYYFENNTYEKNSRLYLNSGL